MLEQSGPRHAVSHDTVCTAFFRLNDVLIFYDIAAVVGYDVVHGSS